MNAERQAIFDTMCSLLDTDKMNDVDDTFTLSDAWANFKVYLASSDKREAYNEVYLVALEKMIRKSLGLPALWSTRVDKIINFSMELDQIPSHPQSISDDMLESLGEHDLIQFKNNLSNFSLEVNTHKGQTSLRIKHDPTPSVTLERSTARIFQQNQDDAKHNILCFFLLDQLPLEKQVSVYLALGRADLQSYDVEVTSAMLLNRAAFTFSDIYMETAVQAALTVMDDVELAKFKAALIAQFNIQI